MKKQMTISLNDSGQGSGFVIRRNMLLCCLLVLLTMLGFGGWGVYSAVQTFTLQQTIHALEHAGDGHELQLSALQDKLAAQQKKLAVYARTLGRMQAHVSRLDSLGSKLVDVASLNKAEFDFGLKPAFGGLRPPDIFAENDDFSDGMQQVDGRLQQLNVQLVAIDYMLENRRGEQNAKPQAWPTEGGWMSSGFGPRLDPFTGAPAMHRGVDIANRLGAPVKAASRGIVTFAGKMEDFGMVVDIEHGYGYKTRYGHMGSLEVKVGDVVKGRQLLGALGSSGRSTGPHVHYEVLHFGRHINPAKYLPRS